MKRVMIAVFLAGLAAWPTEGATERPTAEMPMAEQAPATEPLVIVVNRQNPVDNLSFKDLRAIFLGSRRYWSDGRRITLVMREPGEVERKIILHDVCGMTEDQFKLHFVRGLYTGDILVSPKTLDTSFGVRRFIFNVPGAIGYLRMSDLDATVKPVRIDEQLPGDSAYRLRIPDWAVN